jgi:RHS repeat-associated protein
VVELYEYDVFGKPTIWDMSTLDIVGQSTLGNPYMFTGRRLDGETGLYYYRFRYYDPYTGRFLQTDPIGYVGGLNLYQYCFNNPVNWVDPLGLYNPGAVTAAMALSLPWGCPCCGPSEKTCTPTEEEAEEERERLQQKAKDWYKNKHPGYRPFFRECDYQAAKLMEHLMNNPRPGFWGFDLMAGSSRRRRRLLGPWQGNHTVLRAYPYTNNSSGKPFTMDPYRRWFRRNPPDLPIGRPEDFRRDYPYPQH